MDFGSVSTQNVQGDLPVDRDSKGACWKNVGYTGVTSSLQILWIQLVANGTCVVADPD